MRQKGHLQRTSFLVNDRSFIIKLFSLATLMMDGNKVINHLTFLYLYPMRL